MNKGDFIRELAKKTGYTIKDSGVFYEAFVDVTATTLKKGEKINLVGFGTFEARKKKATTAVNPSTKEKINVPAKTVPALRFGKSFKELIAK